MSDDTLDDELENDPELDADDEDGEDEEIVVDDLIDDDDDAIVDVVDPEAVVEADADEDEEDADAVPTAKRRKAGAEDEDEEEEEDDDDIEEDLDTILKDRIKASDDEEEEDEPEEPGADSSERVAAKTADEFTCPTCFLIVHPRQFGRTGARTCPEGYDRCGAIEQLDKAAKKSARKR